MQDNNQNINSQDPNTNLGTENASPDRYDTDINNKNSNSNNNNNASNSQNAISNNAFVEINEIRKKKQRLIYWTIGSVILILIIGITIIYFTEFYKPNKSKLITLTMWGIRQPGSVYTPVIKEYEKLNPNVKIVYQQVPSTYYESSLFNKLSSGVNEPDIVSVGNTYIPIYQKFLSPAPASVITKLQFQNLFYSTAVSDFTSGNNVYALPSNYDGLALFYNKTEFQKAGLTAPSSNINTFISQIPKLVVKNSAGNVTQAAIDIGTNTSNINNSYNILTYLMFLNKTKMISGNAVTFANGQNGQEALNIYNKIAQEDQWGATFPNSISAFAGGSVAMVFEPSWEVQNILKLNPNLNLGIVMPPQIPGNTVNLSLYFGRAVTKYSKNPTAAWKFIRYLDSRNVLLQLYNSEIQNGEVLGEVFPRVDMASLASKYKYMSPFVQMAPSSKTWAMGDYRKTANIFENVINGKITLKEAQSKIYSMLIQITNGNYSVPPNE